MICPPVEVVRGGVTPVLIASYYICRVVYIASVRTNSVNVGHGYTNEAGALLTLVVEVPSPI